jgi:hypothetical protein
LQPEFTLKVVTVKKTTLFKLPENFGTIVKDSKKDIDLWEEILEAIFHSKAVETKYCGRTVFYFQFGPLHASHFMGRN